MSNIRRRFPEKQWLPIFGVKEVANHILFIRIMSRAWGGEQGHSWLEGSCDLIACRDTKLTARLPYPEKTGEEST